MFEKIRNQRNITLNVRPVVVGLAHEYVFEGPCRFGKGDELTPEFDRAKIAMIADGFNKQIHEVFGQVEGVKVLDPIVMTRDETFPITDEILATMAEGVEDVDLYVPTFFPFGADLVLAFAKKYHKPFGVKLAGNSTGSATMAAMSARGLECYGWATWEDAKDDLLALRARKVLHNIRALCLVRNNSTRSISAQDSFMDHEFVTEKLGVNFTYMNLHEFVDQTHEVDPSTNTTLPGRVEHNINEEDAVEIRRIANDLIAGATETTMPAELVYKSVRANYMVRKLLELTDCNAFTAPCPDMCATRRLNEEQFTLCLNHSLNNECGICSACEYDVTALISMVLLSALSGKAPYMGNTFIAKHRTNQELAISNGMKRDKVSYERIQEAAKDKSAIVATYHSTPNRKMHGFDSEMDSYALHPFAMDGRWGATIRYDFTADAGKPVTVVRFDPTCTKIFVTRGKVVSGTGYTEENCSLGVYYEVPDADKFLAGSMLVGNHCALVLDDVYDAVVRYAELVGLEVLAGE